MLLLAVDFVFAVLQHWSFSNVKTAGGKPAFLS